MADGAAISAGLTLRRRARTASGEGAWSWIALAFAVYWVLFVAGAYANQPQLNNVGATVILATVGWLTLERLWVRVDAVAIACLAAAVIPLVVLAITNAAPYPDAIVKHASLYLIMAASRLLGLPVASRSKMRAMLAAQILIVLVLSVTTDRGGVWDGGTRHSGLFANPNNLALIPFLLLFFIDRRRDRIALQIGAHAMVVAVLAWSRTSGAVIAYAIGLGVYFGGQLKRPWKLLAGTLLSLGTLLLAALVLFADASILPESRLTSQISVMRGQLDTVLSGGQVAYYEQERTLGPGSASAIWRLAHWRHTLTTWQEGNLAQQLVGFGIGSSPGFLGKLPHNEYLRVLFEQGIVGLTLFLFAWGSLIKTAARDVRYCGLILAIYSFSENNLDNFPFMALFILCLGATGPLVRVPADRTTAHRVSFTVCRLV